MDHIDSARAMSEILNTGEALTEYAENHEKKQDVLEQAKQKAQVVAATAMSVVDMTLLIQVLDNGPTFRFYEATVIVISVSLGLQIIAGMISLCVTQQRNYFTTFGDSAVSDASSYMCPCMCASNIKQRSDKKEKSDQTNVCCPWTCTAVSGDEYAISIISKYNTATSDYVNMEMDAICSSSSPDQTKIQVEFRDKQKQCQKLHQYVQLVKKDQVLKMATFWQNIVNFILFVVCILNIVASGFLLGKIKSNGSESKQPESTLSAIEGN